MKVKVGEQVYDSEEIPLMLILTQADKDRIAAMAPGATKYASFPRGMSIPEVEAWMRDLITK